MEKSDKVEIKYPVFKMTRMCCCGKSSDGPINLQVTHNLVLNLKLIRERLKEIHHSVFVSILWRSQEEQYIHVITFCTHGIVLTDYTCLKNQILSENLNSAEE